MIGQLQRQHVPCHHARQVNDPQAVEHTLEIGIEGFLLHRHLFHISMPYTMATCEYHNASWLCTTLSWLDHWCYRSGSTRRAGACVLRLLVIWSAAALDLSL